jgi:PHD/YefM family antitoxin component YafN of YafNO toxin-antitoxin module
MPKTITSTEARKSWSDVLNRAKFSRQRFLIERNAQPVAAIVSPADLEELEEASDRSSAEQALRILVEKEGLDPEARIDHVATALCEQVIEALDPDTPDREEILRRTVELIQEKENLNDTAAAGKA